MHDVDPSISIRLPRMPQAVVFDMDGLLFDTEALYRDAMLMTAQALERHFPLSLYLATIGLSGEATRQSLSRHFGADFDLDRFWQQAAATFHGLATTQLRLKPGVAELIGSLEDLGIPFAIATSSGHNDVERNLGLHGLLDRFPVVVAHGDYQVGKPHPEPFLTAARRLSVVPELCLALEDSHNGVRSASSAGMMTIMVPDLLVATEEIRSLCVSVASDLDEVHHALLYHTRGAHGPA
ncbi:HAD family hydrolase [Ensifer sp. 4252]|uniref:HAD family hydrolase n=1 Tax=Ensifer sp. 4252 TaxID=3373915 RepID=UPI003D20DC83